MRRLNLKKLKAILSALDAALAGGGFDGGDFDGLDPRDFEAARDWAIEQIVKLEVDRMTPQEKQDWLEGKWRDNA